MNNYQGRMGFAAPPVQAHYPRQVMPKSRLLLSELLEKFQNWLKGV